MNYDVHSTCVYVYLHLSKGVSNEMTCIEAKGALMMFCINWTPKAIHVLDRNTTILDTRRESLRSIQGEFGDQFLPGSNSLFLPIVL